MCGVVEGIMAASAFISLAAQDQAASQEHGYQKRLVSAQSQAQMQQAENANTAAANQLAQLGIQQAQENNAEADALGKNKRDHQAAIATGTVAAAEGGVSGVSVDALLADFDRQLGEHNAAIRYTTDMGEVDRHFQRKAIAAQAANRTAAIQPVMPRGVAGPDYGAAIGTLANAYRYNQQRGTK